MKNDELEPLVLHLRLPVGHPDRLTVPQASPIPLDEMLARRRSVAECRADLRLEGIDTPPELVELGEQFIRGELTPDAYRDACFAVATRGMPNKDWTRLTGRLD